MTLKDFVIAFRVKKHPLAQIMVIDALGNVLKSKQPIQIINLKPYEDELVQERYESLSNDFVIVELKNVFKLDECEPKIINLDLPIIRLRMGTAKAIEKNIRENNLLHENGFSYKTLTHAFTSPKAGKHKENDWALVEIADLNVIIKQVNEQSKAGGLTPKELRDLKLDLMAKYGIEIWPSTPEFNTNDQ